MSAKSPMLKSLVIPLPFTREQIAEWCELKGQPELRELVEDMRRECNAPLTSFTSGDHYFPGQVFRSCAP
jgi:hypothetical protein